MELVIAQVEGGVDGFEGLEVDVDLLLLPLLGHDGPAVDDEPVGRDLGVQFESVLDRGNSTEYRQPRA